MSVSDNGAQLSTSGFSDYGESTDPNRPIIDPATYNLDLAGQIINFPGGGITSGITYASDPAGIGTISTNPAINPNPTGGWMTQMTALLNSSLGAFKAFEQGSPAVAIPRPVTPSTGVLQKLFAPPVAGSGNGIGPFSWGAIAAIGVGVAALVVIAKVA